MAKPITAAGGVVFRLNEAHQQPDGLLILRNGYWDLPKGKLEEDESIPMCAVREVAEETESILPILVADLGTTYHEYIEKGKLMGKTTFWYSMVFPREVELSPQQEEGIVEIRWVPLDEAVTKVGYENLKLVLSRFQKQF